MKVKKGDTVVVIAGKDKGAKGKVIQAYPKDNRVLVEGEFRGRGKLNSGCAARLNRKARSLDGSVWRV
jgi:ribosomal protein L24